MTGETHPRARHRRARVARLLRIVTAVTALVHVPVALGVAEMLARLDVRHPYLWSALWAVGGVAGFVGCTRAGMPDRQGDVVARIAGVPYFIHWCAAVFAFIPSVVATLVALPVERLRGEPAVLPAGVYLAAYLTGLVVAGYGVLVRRRWFRVVERPVRIAGLDPRLDGFRIAHLSDLHIGTHTPRSRGLAWARAANRANPDLALVTGDMITSGIEFHSDVADILGALRAGWGVFASMGNHDYFGDGEGLAARIEERGVRVLRNEGVVVERNDARLWVAAIDDTWTGRDDVAAAMRERPDRIATVLLAHDPVRFDQAADAGATLVLSGHTHGGQIGVPFLYRSVNLAISYRYRLGFYRRGASVLYVHPGLGTTGPPMRLGVGPEVTILVLRADPA